MFLLTQSLQSKLSNKVQTCKGDFLSVFASREVIEPVVLRQKVRYSLGLPSLAWAHRPSGNERRWEINIPFVNKVIATGRNNSSFNCVPIWEQRANKGSPFSDENDEWPWRLSTSHLREAGLSSTLLIMSPGWVYTKHQLTSVGESVKAQSVLREVMFLNCASNLSERL